MNDWRTIVLSSGDGTMRKLIDVTKLHSLGWTHKVEIEDGVQRLFDWYKSTIEPSSETLGQGRN